MTLTEKVETYAIDGVIGLVEGAVETVKNDIVNEVEQVEEAVLNESKDSIGSFYLN